VLAPRLTAVSSRAAVDEMIHGRRPRNNQVFSPKIGNESDAEGWKNLKKSLDIVWRLVLWRQGKLLNRTYEASLPMEERLLFPGRETSSVVRLMHMDASGKAMFCFDETSGRHCPVVFSKAEQELFNAFEDENSTHIALRELMGLLYACTLLGVKYPDTILDACNDNQVVVAWLNGKATSCPKAAQMLYLISMAQTIGKFDARTRWVDTATNVFADRGSREVGEGELEALLAEWRLANPGKQTE